jgi:hypothetical protein
MSIRPLDQRLLRDWGYERNERRFPTEIPIWRRLTTAFFPGLPALKGTSKASKNAL